MNLSSNQIFVTSLEFVHDCVIFRFPHIYVYIILVSMTLIPPCINIEKTFFDELSSSLDHDMTIDGLARS